MADPGIVQALVVIVLVAALAGVHQWRGWNATPKGRHRAPRGPLNTRKN